VLNLVRIVEALNGRDKLSPLGGLFNVDVVRCRRCSIGCGRLDRSWICLAPAPPAVASRVGGSNTSYAVVAVGDYFGNGTSDILFRNNSTGDTWFEAINNGASAGWNQVGGSNTSYTVKT
jgi:hypothetical protein